MTDLIAGPSGGALGTGGGLISVELLDKHPDLARQIVTIGRYRRAGYDRARWETVDWADYRARVGIGGRSGPWRIWASEVRDSDPDPDAVVSAWVAEAEGLPPAPPGVYTELLHDERGLVMSDVPAEVCGALPFLDHAAALRGGRMLIGGLGLGIVPAWLLARTDTPRIDVIEIDADVAYLTTSSARACAEPGRSWADDPRLHIHYGDAHTWWPGAVRGCQLHDACVLPATATWDACWLDIWDTISPANLPSMHRLTRRWSRRAQRIWSWERAECEAMRRRGQTVERPYCFISETGYPAMATADTP